MKVSKSFISDFEYLTSIFKWNSEDAEEMKDAIRSNPKEMMPHIIELAAQWRKAEHIPQK